MGIWSKTVSYKLEVTVMGMQKKKKHNDKFITNPLRFEHRLIR